jgi:CRP-like cAMP-binding protein
MKQFGPSYASLTFGGAEMAGRKHSKNLLRSIVEGKTVLRFRKRQTIFSEGQNADSIYFIETGKVNITVLSPTGKEAALSLLGPDDFFGEGCLAGQSVRADTATALETSVVVRIEKEAMQRGLRDLPELSENFLVGLLAQNIRLKEDLSDQFFNHSEKRLARVLVKIAQLNEHGRSREVTVPRINHETLAEMVGTTRSRVTHFMNEFRKHGLIDYDGELTIRPVLLTESILQD